MKITVVGTGYVGLVSGTCFSELGNDVICVDKIDEKVTMLKNGEIPIYEPGLKELVQKNQAEGRLSFTTDIKEAVNKSDLIFIAVGTPSDETGAANMSYVYAVAQEIGQAVDSTFKVVVNKSTVPIGTAEEVERLIKEQNADADVSVCSVPEFLREGSAVSDTFNPDRIIIGTSCERARDMLIELHRPLTEQILLTDVRSSEMIKYASNAFLATKISFINEIANICDAYGADVTDVAKGMGLDDRIGPKFLQAGLGYGGSCFPKDTKALIHLAESKSYEPQLLHAVKSVNDRQYGRVVHHVKGIFGDDTKGLKVALLGLAFKPNTDDMRDAPSLKIIEDLTHLGMEVVAYDPISMDRTKELIGDKITYANNVEDTLKDADLVILVTEWDEFKQLDIKKVKELVRRPVFIDGRNVFEPSMMKEAGYIYHGVGRQMN
ncbi:UDP-glucose/GDP-mannose dehydrogenase family protein [Alkalihalophilus pseudofirmus]|jgi:UDPglucose 6-dehydrogenase|uniref:UDP-glucose 6-dehydrogenase n=1 Tax=Alkalihalophilus pseudofirmus TaxID=79885 RepID=A0AAJ2NPQ8_ALKPS|nr:UDP-glucose/GDP-mannose dehydrogenase family protein [Alkalihalophilus pseudofirmus]MDV2886315.1 UDP-glucose/GDP-mannose dehydrogenase family protein [Alkalihalophilus pseudofirmus]